MFVDIFVTNKKYNIIYADPPWKYIDNKCNGNCEKYYQTMNLNDICNLPISNITDNDCVLFLWCTYPMLKEGLEVIKKWGFKYKTIGFQWIKLNKSGKGYFFGLGHWTRGNTECCLIGVKGKPKRKSKSISQLIFSPLKSHSQKPNEVREKIVELIGDIPRIELFARQKVDGWDCWGNQVSYFNEKSKGGSKNE